MNKEDDLKTLLGLKSTQWGYVHWAEEGGGEVQRVHDVYVLFEIPLYGGEPQYVNTYLASQLDDLLTEIYSRT